MFSANEISSMQPIERLLCRLIRYRMFDLNLDHIPIKIKTIPAKLDRILTLENEALHEIIIKNQTKKILGKTLKVSDKKEIDKEYTELLAVLGKWYISLDNEHKKVIDDLGIDYNGRNKLEIHMGHAKIAEAFENLADVIDPSKYQENTFQDSSAIQNKLNTVSECLIEAVKPEDPKGKDAEKKLLEKEVIEVNILPEGNVLEETITLTIEQEEENQKNEILDDIKAYFTPKRNDYPYPIFQQISNAIFDVKNLSTLLPRLIEICKNYIEDRSFFQTKNTYIDWFCRAIAEIDKNIEKKRWGQDFGRISTLQELIIAQQKRDYINEVLIPDWNRLNDKTHAYADNTYTHVDIEIEAKKKAYETLKKEILKSDTKLSLSKILSENSKVMNKIVPDLKADADRMYPRTIQELLSFSRGVSEATTKQLLDKTRNRLVNENPKTLLQTIGLEKQRIWNKKRSIDAICNIDEPTIVALQPEFPTPGEMTKDVFNHEMTDYNNAKFLSDHKMQLLNFKIDNNNNFRLVTWNVMGVQEDGAYRLNKYQRENVFHIMQRHEEIGIAVNKVMNNSETPLIFIMQEVKGDVDFEIAFNKTKDNYQTNNEQTTACDLRFIYHTNYNKAVKNANYFNNAHSLSAAIQCYQDKNSGKKLVIYNVQPPYSMNLLEKENAIKWILERRLAQALIFTMSTFGQKYESDKAQIESIFKTRDLIKLQHARKKILDKLLINNNFSQKYTDILRKLSKEVLIFAGDFNTNIGRLDQNNMNISTHVGHGEFHPDHIQTPRFFDGGFSATLDLVKGEYIIRQAENRSIDLKTGKPIENPPPLVSNNPIQRKTIAMQTAVMCLDDSYRTDKCIFNPVNRQNETIFEYENWLRNQFKNDDIFCRVTKDSNNVTGIGLLVNLDFAKEFELFQKRFHSDIPLQYNLELNVTDNSHTKMVICDTTGALPKIMEKFFTYQKNNKTIIIDNTTAFRYEETLKKKLNTKKINFAMNKDHEFTLTIEQSVYKEVLKFYEIIKPIHFTLRSTQPNILRFDQQDKDDFARLINDFAIYTSYINSLESRSDATIITLLFEGIYKIRHLTGHNHNDDYHHLNKEIDLLLAEHHSTHNRVLSNPTEIRRVSEGDIKELTNDIIHSIENTFLKEARRYGSLDAFINKLNSNNDPKYQYSRQLLKVLMDMYNKNPEYRGKLKPLSTLQSWDTLFHFNNTNTDVNFKTKDLKISSIKEAFSKILEMMKDVTNNNYTMLHLYHFIESETSHDKFWEELLLNKKINKKITNNDIIEYVKKKLQPDILRPNFMDIIKKNIFLKYTDSDNDAKKNIEKIVNSYNSQILPLYSTDDHLKQIMPFKNIMKKRILYALHYLDAVTFFTLLLHHKDDKGKSKEQSRPSDAHTLLIKNFIAIYKAILKSNGKSPDDDAYLQKFAENQSHSYSTMQAVIKLASAKQNSSLAFALCLAAEYTNRLIDRESIEKDICYCINRNRFFFNVNPKTVHESLSDLTHVITDRYKIQKT